MKSHLIFFVIALFSLTACSDDLGLLGYNTEVEQDTLFVNAKSFDIETENIVIDSINSRPDPIALLGIYTDNTYNSGTCTASILTQLQAPLNYSCPANSTPVSAKLKITFTNGAGSTNPTLHLKVYRMNTGLTFNYSNTYYSNVKVNDYVDPLNKIEIGEINRNITKLDTTMTIEIPLSDDFRNSLASVLTTPYTTNTLANFQQLLNGLYICPESGSNAIIYSTDVRLEYNYSYDRPGYGPFTTHMDFPYNLEVRRVNKISYQDQQTIKNTFDTDITTNVVSSPANLYTRIKVNLDEIKNNTTIDNKKRIINAAQVKLNVLNSIQPPTELLLIKETDNNINYFESFFKKRSEFDDTKASKAKYNSTNKTYTFSLTKILEQELKNNASGTINFILVPVSIAYIEDPIIREIKHLNTLSFVKFASPSHATYPLKLRLAYSQYQ